MNTSMFNENLQLVNMSHLLHGYDVGINLGDDRARVWVKGKCFVFDEPIDGGWRINQQYETKA